MLLLKLILIAPVILAITLALIGSFLLTLHRRRGRACANSPSIYVTGKVRTVESPYFDTYVVQAGSQVGGSQGNVTMFSQQRGAINATWPNGVPDYITNMEQPNQLPGGESFLMRAFRIVPIGMAEVDLITFQQQFNVKFRAGTGKYAYCDAPPEFWPGGAGSFTPGTGTASANGIPDSRSIMAFLTDPILLTDGLNFNALLQGTPFTASALFWLRIYLEGQKTQPAQ